MPYLQTVVEPSIALSPGEIMPDLQDKAAARSEFGSAGRAVAAVWATCLLLALAFPQAIASWLDDFEPNPVVAVAQNCTSRLMAVSETLGIATFSGAARELGKSVVRKPE
ncbi:hypothetical protein [Methylobacterium persicinum]|uniref:Uncharacterized protein n=1 Tax=Methylobacterium persicinum TaxID=374426 RepID=A0ABU0HSL1_9HYPH|nr:hypothetical protein [Methylobacterium persicinum]MDQ0445328.1 hypothetical protein [Methylobacterium persicinum]GJE39783.1 hypothetical protein KHHGKMAE_3869 [Methylobacterium persicinum]